MLTKALQRARDLADQTGRPRVANFCRLAARLTPADAERLSVLATGYARAAVSELAADQGPDDSRRRLLDLLDVALGAYRWPEVERIARRAGLDLTDSYRPGDHGAPTSAPERPRGGAGSDRQHRSESPWGRRATEPDPEVPQ
jgi:hypothetical protein